MSDYYLNLSKDDKHRYDDKLLMISVEDGDTGDPFLAGEEWIDDVTKWPDVEFGQIYVYLIDSPGPYTRETMKAYRSLEAYNQYYSGWVHTTFLRETGSHLILKSKVNRSQAVTDKPHEAWVAISKCDSSISCGHCTCMAGVAGVCSHVAALLFKIEACHRLKFNQISCTSLPCQWNQNFTKKVTPLPVSKINFKKPRKGQQLSETSSEPVSATVFQNTSTLLTKLKESNPSAVIFTITEPKFVSIPSAPSLPPVLDALYKSEYSSMEPAALKLKCLEVFSKLTVTEQQCEKLESLTRNQRHCSAWFSYRRGRLTASNFHEISHTNTLHNSSSSLLCKLMQYEPFRKTKAMEWGIQNEANAIEEYRKILQPHHESFKFHTCGLMLHQDFPYLGATPDGLVECDCCGSGVLEVKCPFTKKDCVPCHVDQAQFFLRSHKRTLEPLCPPSLKSTDKYYSQIQGQIAICKASYCDFVCWTPYGIHIERILPDPSYFKSMAKQLREYFLNVALPEILTHNLRRKSDKSYCFCWNGEDYDNMIACDNKSCNTEWYHFKYVGLKSAPPGKWLCLKCRHAPEK